MKSLILNCCTMFSLAACYGQDQVAPLISERHSGRAYDAKRPVKMEQIKVLVEAASLAPSSYNEQPWYFIICDKNTQPDAYQKAFNSLVEFNQGWAKKEAPVLVVVLSNTKSAKNQEFNRWGTYDTGAAALNMMLEASSLGLMAHQMGGFDENKIQKEFNIPEGVVPMSVMAIGYEKAGENIPKKERKSISDNFFLGSWGKSIGK